MKTDCINYTTSCGDCEEGGGVGHVGCYSPPKSKKMPKCCGTCGLGTPASMNNSAPLIRCNWKPKQFPCWHSTGSTTLFATDGENCFCHVEKLTRQERIEKQNPSLSVKTIAGICGFCETENGVHAINCPGVVTFGVKS